MRISAGYFHQIRTVRTNCAFIYGTMCIIGAVFDSCMKLGSNRTACGVFNGILFNSNLNNIPTTLDANLTHLDANCHARFSISVDAVTTLRCSGTIRSLYSSVTFLLITTLLTWIAPSSLKSHDYNSD